jgi:hypothetical protein
MDLRELWMFIQQPVHEGAFVGEHFSFVADPTGLEPIMGESKIQVRRESSFRV